ncbi:MAG: Na+/H+ antiporter subunit E [Vicinamibacterales bacterium]|jgi:multicomponent Na+:H+ antiporter subunit E|nr:Na+/H+ antiporter subunit E [Vicinamibacterales bacterium]
MRVQTPTGDSGIEREARPPQTGGGWRDVVRNLPFTGVLFAFWLILSGEVDPFHLLVGAACAVTVAATTGRLLRLPPAVGPSVAHPLAGVSWIRFLTYLPWLAGQVVRANLHVVGIVLHPRLPIDPCLVRLDVPAPHTLARLTLTNSITLTPGTVTLDADADGYLVHALTTRSAAGLEQGATIRRVQRLFTAAAPDSSPVVER